MTARAEGSALLRRLAGHDPGRLALSDGDGVALTYGELLAAVDDVAASLRAHGAYGVALAMDNGPAQVVADLGALAAGVWTLALPPFFTPAQRAGALARAGCALVLDDGSFPANAPELARLRVANRTLHLRATGVAAVDGTRPGTAKVTFTSGSTGDPKGACLSEAHLLGPVRRIARRVDAMGVERHLAVLPLAVLLENVAGVYAALHAGIECVVPSLSTTGLAPAAGAPAAPSVMPAPAAAASATGASALHAALVRTGGQSCILVPELLRGLVAARDALGPLPALRYLAVGGARVGPALLDAAAAAGLPVHEGYGLTEAASVVAVNLPGERRAGSVGRPLGHRRIHIDAGGEILLDAPGFLGYCGDAHAPPSPYRTGDLGRLDADGYLYVEGRSKHVLITSMGRNVSPEWVEAALTGDGTIVQALVHGDGERMLSALVVSRGSDAAIGAAVTEANAGLPDYARIGAWRRVPPFTREGGLLTGNGKPRRAAVLARYAEPIAA